MLAQNELTEKRGDWSTCCKVNSSRNTNGINLMVVHVGSKQVHREKRGGSSTTVQGGLVPERVSTNNACAILH